MIREYIVSAALVGASSDLQKKIKEKSEKEGIDYDGKEDVEWADDPLGIAIPWEEKYKKKKEEK